jgi:putative transposase
LIIGAFLLKEEGMKKKQQRDRELAVKRYLQGEEISAIAKSLGRSRPWVYKWVERKQASSAEIDWCADQTRAPHSNSRQLSREVVEAVKLARLHLYNQGLFCGAQAINWELAELGLAPMPSLRTINRVLSREGLTHRRTGRYEPKGKKYPQLCGDSANEVHQTDYVGPCYLRGALLQSQQCGSCYWSLRRDASSQQSGTRDRRRHLVSLVSFGAAAASAS